MQQHCESIIYQGVRHVLVNTSSMYKQKYDTGLWGFEVYIHVSCKSSITEINSVG